MGLVQYSDGVKLVTESGESFNIISSVTVQGMTTPRLLRTDEGAEFYRPLIAAELARVPGGKSKYLDEAAVLAIMYKESRFNSRANNNILARGLGQFMPATGKEMGVIDAYNYADHIKGMVKFMNINWKHYEKRITDRDLIISCGVCAHAAGRRDMFKPVGEYAPFKQVKDKLFGTSVTSYLQDFEKQYRYFGGQAFRTSW